MLPHDAKARKAIPLYTFLTQYFPDAIAELVKVSVAGNAQHTPGQPLHWARGKSTDQMDAAMRHLFDHGSGIRFGADGQRTLAQAAWRLMAQLQLDIEAEASLKVAGQAIDNRSTQSCPPVVNSPYTGTMQARKDNVNVWQDQKGCDAPGLGKGAWIPHYQPGHIQGSGEGATWCQEGEFCQDGEAPL